jgi:peptidoglycan/LPS O-acetylase OafA/YrhL
MRELLSVPAPQFQKLNLLRFLAASMVAIFHGGYLFSTTHPRLYEFFIWGSDGVFIFFIVSGLIIPWSMEQSNYKIASFFPFLSKRFRRLFPPFLCSLLIYWMGWHLSFKPTWGESLMQLLSNLLFMIPFGKGSWVNQIYWTLFIEIQFYVITGLLFYWLRHKNHWHQLTVLVSLNLLSFVTFLLPAWTEKNFIFFHLPYFSLGYLLFMIFRKQTFTLLHLSSLAFILLVLIINIVFLHHIPLSSIIFSILTFIYILFFNTTFKFLEKLGDYSYSYYLLHGLMIAWFYYFFNIPETFMGKWIHLFAVICLSWILAYLGYIIIEKKSLLWSKKIKYHYAPDHSCSK